VFDTGPWRGFAAVGAMKADRFLKAADLARNRLAGATIRKNPMGHRQARWSENRWNDDSCSVHDQYLLLFSTMPFPLRHFRKLTELVSFPDTPRRPRFRVLYQCIGVPYAEVCWLSSKKQSG